MVWVAQVFNLRLLQCRNKHRLQACATYNIGYADNDALRLGVNIFAYAVTH